MGSAEFGVLFGTENASFAPATTMGGSWRTWGSTAGAGIGFEYTDPPRTIGGATKMGGVELGWVPASPVTIGGRSVRSFCLGIGSAARMAPKAVLAPTSIGRTIAISFVLVSSSCSVSCNAKHGAIAGPEIVAKKASILILKF